LTSMLSKTKRRKDDIQPEAQNRFSPAGADAAPVGFHGRLHRRTARGAAAGRPRPGGGPAAAFDQLLLLHGRPDGPKEGRADQAEAYLADAVEQDPGSVHLKMQLATLFFQRNLTEKGLAVLENVLAEHPDHIPALMLYGRVQESRENRDKAREAYEKVVAQHPPNESVYLLLGNIYIAEEKWDAALDLYQELVRLVPASYAGHFFIGKINRHKGRLKAAEAALKKALLLEPELEEARFELLEVYRLNDDTEGIIQMYQEILDHDPDNIRAAIGLGYFYKISGFAEEGDQLLKNLGARSAEDVEVIRKLVQYYLDPQQYAQALVILEGMRLGNPESADLQYLTAVALDGEGKKAAALEHFLKVEDGTRFFENAALHAAILFQEQGRIDDAIDYMQKVIESHPENPEFRLYLGSFYEEAEQYPAAETALKKGLALDPENVRILFRLGVVYDKWGNKEASIAKMRSVIQLDPENANALNYLGYTFAEMGENLDEAEQLIKQALEFKPDDGYITDSLGWVYFKKGMLAEALFYLEKAARLTPDDPIIAEHLGDAYRRSGNIEKALEYYRKSLENNHQDPAAVEAKIKSLTP